MGGLFNIFGSPNPQAEATIAEVGLPLNATISQQQKVLDELFNAFKGFGWPSNSARASAPGNIFASVMGAYVNLLKNATIAKGSTTAASILHAVSEIVADLDPTMDPIRGMLAQSAEITGVVADAVKETLPDVFAMVGSIIFSPPTQSRSVGDLVADFTAIIQAIMSGVTTVVGRVAQVPGAVVGDVMGAVNGVISNVTRISTSKSGLDGGFHLTEQAIGALSRVVEELIRLVHEIANPLIDLFATDFENMIIQVNKQMGTKITHSLNTLNNGKMSKCAPPLTNSMLEFGLGVNEAVTFCLRREVDTLLKPLDSTVTALTKTVATITNTNRVLDMCLSWNIWGCVWDVSYSCFMTSGRYSNMGKCFFLDRPLR